MTARPRPSRLKSGRLSSLPEILLTDNYTGIQLPLPSVLGDDGLGGTIELGHTAWLEGPWPGPGGTFAPAVIGQQGCGRLQFTSYHTAGQAHVGMIPRELLMLYSVLEVGVCQEEIPVPEQARAWPRTITIVEEGPSPGSSWAEALDEASIPGAFSPPPAPQFPTYTQIRARVGK